MRMHAFLIEDDDFPVLHVAHVLGADHVKRAGLRSENGMAVKLADDQGPDAERIAGADELLVGEPDERDIPHAFTRFGSMLGAGEVLDQIRQMVFEGKEKEVAPLVRERFLSDPVRQKAYQPFGDIRLAFPASGEVSERSRL